MRRHGKLALSMVALALSCTVGLRDAAAAVTWTSLFNGKDLTGWKEIGGQAHQWEVKDGMIHCKGAGGGGLMTEKEYSNFEVELEYRTSPGGNSGIYLRVPMDMKPNENPSYVGMEIQVLDDFAAQYAHLHPEQYCGSIYDVVAAKRGAVKPAGEWGKMDIVCDHRHVKVTLNDQLIVDANLDDHKNKYPTHPGITPERTGGRVGLQNHTDPLDFRNLRIRELP